VSQGDLIATIHNLLADGRFETIAEVLARRIQGVRNYAEWLAVQQALECLPDSSRLDHPRLAVMYATSLSCTRGVDALLEFGRVALAIHDGHAAELIRSKWAWALSRVQRHQEAIAEATRALPFLEGADLGFTHKVLAQAKFALHEPWENALESARALLTGRALGILMLDEGYFLDSLGHGEAARHIWVEALGLLEPDTYYLAWLRFNLGISSLRDSVGDAERHFLEMQALTRSKVSAGMRARAAQGLGTARCVKGEWVRAESAFRDAIRLAKEPMEQIDAHWGLAHTLRLANHQEEALEWYAKAAQIAGPQSWVNVDRALALLEIGQSHEAQKWLAHVGPLRGSDVWRASVLKGELARRTGDLETALELISSIPAISITAREEVERWPKLFSLLQEHGRTVPVPFECIVQTIVKVQALGVLRVEVNGRAVPIKPTGRIGELLVFLLEHDGTQTVERLIDAMFDQTTTADHERKRHAIWDSVKQLRLVLGWPQSVRALGGTYQLDPQVQWHYDARDARERGEVINNFLEGVYSAWIDEVRHP
jgi:tetratricopeptide (TPR) repeat protein